jgi:hypothetical protein
MKISITTLLLLITTTTFAQEISGVTIANKKPIYTENSDIIIRYLNPKKDTKNNPAIFINGEFFKEGFALLKTLSPNKIESVNVEKGNVTIDETTYYGKLLIVLKPNYKPSITTINNLISKNLTLDNNPIILKIDGDYVNGNFNNYIVDENFILQIDVTTIKTSKNDQVNLIYLITKSDKNLEKANQSKKIIIRGTE